MTSTTSPASIISIATLLSHCSENFKSTGMSGIDVFVDILTYSLYRYAPFVITNKFNLLFLPVNKDNNVNIEMVQLLLLITHRLYEWNLKNEISHR